MTDTCAPVLELAEAEALRERVRARRLQDDDYSLVERIITSWIDLSVALDRMDATVARLRKLAFGPSADRRATRPTSDEGAGAATELALDDAASVPDAGGSTSADDSTHTQSDGQAQERKRRKGHGRKPASVFTGAETVVCSDPQLEAGRHCPDPRCRGSLYDTRQPTIFLRFTGQPVVRATRFEQPVLRCSACQTRYTARLPDDTPAQKWDPPADVAIAMAKYGSGLPFYRLAKAQAAFGVPVPDTVLWERCLSLHETLGPIAKHLETLAASADLLYADDTPVRILELIAENKTKAEGERTGMQTTAIVAVLGRIRVALYTSGRKHAGENVGDLLAKREQGLAPPIQMGDAASKNWSHGFKTFVAKCLAHARRQFTDVEARFPGDAGHVLDVLAGVYRIDAETRGKPPAERLAHHKKHSAPLMEGLFAWMQEQLDERRVEPNSVLGQAIRYALRHREGLTLWLRREGAPLDNNIAELVIKPVVLHRKNALVFKTIKGAAVGDRMMTVLETCRLNGVVTWDYLLAVASNAEAVQANPAAWLPWTYALPRGATAARAA
jgi:transposase